MLEGLGLYPLGRGYAKQSTRLTRNCPFDQQQIPLAVYPNHLKLAYGNSGIAELTSHALAGIDPTWGGTRPGGAWQTVIFRTVSHGTTAEVVALLVTRKATANALARDVDELTGFKAIGGDGLSKLVALGGLYAIFFQVAHRSAPRLGQVAQFRLVQRLLGNISEPDLNSRIAIGIWSFNLRNNARPSLNDSDRDGVPCVIKYLGHAQLLAENTDCHSLFSLTNTLQNALTPFAKASAHLNYVDF